MGDEAGAQIREIREMIINKTLDEGTCIDCVQRGLEVCNDDMVLQIPEDAVTIRAAFQDIARECRSCKPGMVCIKILRHSRTAVACDCDGK